MIVILEGVDGSGKTTLCEQLVKHGYKQIRVDDGDYEYNNWLDAKLEYKYDVAIADRSFISDLVYRIYDGKRRRGMNLQQMCGSLFNEIIVVHLESDTEFYDSMRRGEDNVLTLDANTRIKLIYKDVMRMLDIFVGVPIIKYNWRTDDVATIINFVERRKRYAVR